MLRHILIFTALLVAKAMAESRGQTIFSPKPFFIQCNNTSCDCGRRDGNHAFITCNQACADVKCKALSCSFATCHQQCHNCHMECTSDVGFCRQQCLSGACSFKCNARLCEKQCNGGKCENRSSSNHELYLPRGYLILLAGLFALAAILSCLLLVLSFTKGECCWRRAAYLKLKTFSSSLESVDSLPTFV